MPHGPVTKHKHNLYTETQGLGFAFLFVGLIVSVCKIAHSITRFFILPVVAGIIAYFIIDNQQVE
jgi:hypothetical protein